MNFKDLSAQRFGRLVAVSAARVRERGRSNIYWSCKCDCGDSTDVRSSSLIKGATRSCGCLEQESRCTVEHGGVGTRLYNIWCNMKARCTNPRSDGFNNYGGRGISVSERWTASFEAFRADVGDPPSDLHSLDRIKTDGNYVPGNVRWATPKEQGRNKRDTITVRVDGVTMSLADAAEKYGVPYDKAHNRLHELGWRAEEALGLTSRRFSGEIVYAGRER